MTDAPVPASYNFADLWEAVWPLVAERDALVCGPQRRTYAELAERSNRLANHLRAAGVGPGDRVGLFLRNDAGYLEAMIAAFSLRAVPVNMNHRYTGEELGFLLADSAAVALLVHETLTGAVATVPGGRGPPAGADRARRSRPRLGGGRAGRPPRRRGLRGRARGIVARPGGHPRPHRRRRVPHVHRRHHRPAQGRGLAPGGCVLRLHRRRRPHAPRRPGRRAGPAARPDRAGLLVPAPGAAHARRRAVDHLVVAARRRQDRPDARPARSAAVWQAMVDEGVNSLTVVGDAVGRPLVEAWEAEPERWDVANLFAISNGGAPMSPTLKSRLAELFPGRAIVDGFGSSESGVQGSQRLQAGDAITGPGPLRPRSHDGRVRRRPPARGTRFRRDRPGGQRRAPAARLPQRPGEDGEPRSSRSTASATASPATWPRSRPTAPSSCSAAARCASTPAARRCSPRRSSRCWWTTPRWPMCSWWARPTSAGGARSPPWSSPADPAAPPTLDDLRDHLRPPGRLQDPQAPGDRRPQVVRSPAGKADYRWAQATAAEAAADS